MTKTVAFVGLSGVGKSTLIRSLAERIELQHLSAGKLIGEEKARIKEALNHDELRLADIAVNQQLLIDSFNRKKDISAGLVVLDGHTVIDTNLKLEAIPTSVFRAIGIELFIFLHVNPSEILKRRTLDSSRNRPLIGVTEIAEHQAFALEVTESCARELSIPCHVVDTDDINFIISVLNS